MHLIEEDVGGVDTTESHQLLALAERHALAIALDIDGADALAAFDLAEAAIDEIAFGMAAAAAPPLLSVHDPSAVMLGGARREIGRSRAGIGLRHGDRHRQLAAAPGGISRFFSAS